jgi:EAL domain-containing protein (putative c-di-GMP-specific phosphodiesterase class I)
MQVSRDSSKCPRSLRDQGIRLAIDNFGTGYSCFDYLRHFPVSRLKIARCFVDEITKSSGSAAVTRAAIHLGKELGLGLLAEGVETAEQASLLTSWGCRAGQGFYFAGPLGVEGITRLLQAGNIRASSTPTEDINFSAAHLLPVPAATKARLQPAK